MPFQPASSSPAAQPSSMRCSPACQLLASPQLASPSCARCAACRPQRTPAPSAQATSVGRSSAARPKRRATAGTSSRSRSALKAKRCCGARSSHSSATSSGAWPRSRWSAMPQGMWRGCWRPCCPKTLRMAGAKLSMSGTITTMSRGCSGGSLSPPGGCASRCSSWSCRISTSRCALCATWNTTEPSSGASAAGGAARCSCSGTRSRTATCSCCSSVWPGASSNRSTRGSSNCARARCTSSKASSWRTKSRLWRPQAASSGWPCTCICCSGTACRSVVPRGGWRRRGARSSSRPSMVSAQWKRQGLGTAISTCVWADSAAIASSVWCGMWVVPNSTTRRGSAAISSAPCAPGPACSACRNCWCSSARVACCCAGSSAASAARHSAGCQRWSSGTGGAPCAELARAGRSTSWPAAQSCSQSLR